MLGFGVAFVGDGVQPSDRFCGGTNFGPRGGAHLAIGSGLRLVVLPVGGRLLPVGLSWRLAGRVAWLASCLPDV